jgi:hypothetical protein
MGEWADIYARVATISSREYAGLQFFRGHPNADWTLLPGLGRIGPAAAKELGYDELWMLENSMYARFVNRAGRLLEASSDGWANLFAMQHHGLPTRLLDWSTTFAVALHFALLHPADQAAVWILNPYELNREVRGSPSVPDAPFLGSYEEIYDEKSPDTPDVIAISAAAHNSRVASQRAAFTLHNRLDVPLEDLHPRCVQKITIPHAAYGDARQFLHLAGISEFGLFPDLDGLARDLGRTFCLT